jgi:hypothetical protein
MIDNAYNNNLIVRRDHSNNERLNCNDQAIKLKP